MKVFAVTLQYRQFGKAIASHYQAARAWGHSVDWLLRFGGDVSAHAPPDERHAAITLKYSVAREAFLSSPCDVFVSIEDDMVIPDDTFSRMSRALAAGVDVVYGLGCWRGGLAGGAWSAYLEMDNDVGRSVLIDPTSARGLYKSESLVDVVGVGLHCTAITRRVLEQITFETRGQYSNDWYFAQDCEAAGFRQACDFGLRVGHYSEEPTPRILWPSIDNDRFQRVEYLEAM